MLGYIFFHLRMPQFDEILNPNMAESYTHGQPYYGKKEKYEKISL